MNGGHLIPRDTSPIHISSLHQYLSAYHPSPEMVQSLWDQLLEARAITIRDLRPRVVDQDSGDHILVTNGGGSVSLYRRIADYDVDVLPAAEKRIPAFFRDGRNVFKLGAFLTGSQLYGTPTAESDIDLVVIMDQKSADQLAEMADSASRGPEGKEHPNLALRFGRLNLLIFTEEKSYFAWFDATQACLATALDRGEWLTRDEAVETMKQHGNPTPYPGAPDEDEDDDEDEKTLDDRTRDLDEQLRREEDDSRTD